MPNLPTPANVEYQQVGGFGPWTRTQAIDAAKQAGVIGRARPKKVWVQRPRDDAAAGEVLLAVVALLDAAGTRYNTIYKDDDAAAGFGVYYLYDDKVVMEHTSDPESKVKIGTAMKTLPHVHIEVIPYADIANANAEMSDRIKAIGNFKIFDDSGFSPTATRLVRLGVNDPSSQEDKPKFNHHIYYYPP